LVEQCFCKAEVAGSNPATGTILFDTPTTPRTAMPPCAGSTHIAALQPDGMILTPPHSENPLIVQLLVDRGISFARIGSLTPGPGFALTMDDERAARLATEHLIALGHRRIGFIAGPADYALSGWRVDGWHEAMAAAGLPTDGLMQRGDFGHASGRAAAGALLDQAAHVTAIIASNDQMALATLETARARGVDVPRDLSLISFDDTPIVRFTHPPLTAVEQPIADVVACAVKLIIAERAGDAAPDAPIVIPARLSLRQSTAPPRPDR
jgi:LacI family transcriptional regulator